MSRTIRGIWIIVFALAIGSGTALAQDDAGEWDDDDGGDDMGGDDMGGDDGSTAAPAPPDDTAAPAVAAGATAGQIKAGAKVLIPKGLNDEGDSAIGAYIEITPWASYQVNEKINASVSLPLLLIKPDFGDASAELLQGVIVNGGYAVNDKINGKAMLGMARPGRLMINPFGGGNGIAPGGAGDMKIGFGVGGEYVHAMDKIHITAGAMVVVQLESGAVDMDSGDVDPATAAHIPVMVMYAVNEKLSAGVATGIYTGNEFKFSADDGMTVPFIVGAKYAVNDAISAGGFAGLGSLLMPDVDMGPGAGDTLTIGLFAAWTK